MADALGADELFELKLIFLRELAGGYAQARAAYEGLRASPGGRQLDRAAVDVLRHLFHRLAGTAASVDLPLLGRLSAACESACDALLDGSLAPGQHALALLGEGLEGIASVIEGRARPDAPEPRGEGTLAGVALPGPGADSRVLVIDDDVFSARLIEGVLRAAGFSASSCCEADRAFEAIQAERPDLVILDVVMPGLDGFDLCRKVRAHPGLHLTPIIFVTRKGDVEQRVRGLQAGGNDYVAKPFEPRELVARVRSHLQRLAELREMAIRDGLTRCYNARYFKERLGQELLRARRHGNALSLGVLDLDHFKRVNESYGSPAGDAVLAHLATLLTASVRSTDVVARQGGEELAVLMIEAVASDAGIVLGRLRERVARHRFELPAAHGEPLKISCTISIGVAQSRKDETAQELLARVDGALYEAKRGGRNRLCIAE